MAEVFANKVEIQNGSSSTTVSLDADIGLVNIGGNGVMGMLQVFASPATPTDSTKARVVLDSYAAGVLCNHIRLGAHGEAGSLRLMDDLGKETVRIDGSTADIRMGGNGVAGDVIVRNSAGQQTVRLEGNTGTVVIRDWTISAPDYVFKEGYPLRPLDQLEAFVATAHHLPDVPSASQLAHDGINVGKFCMQLLKKVEELSLYAIQQQSALRECEERLASVEAELAARRQ